MLEFLKVVSVNAVVINIWVLGCGSAWVMTFALLAREFRLAGVFFVASLSVLFLARWISKKYVPERAQLIF